MKKRQVCPGLGYSKAMSLPGQQFGLSLSDLHFGQMLCSSEVKQSLRDKEEEGDLKLRHSNRLQPL